MSLYKKHKTYRGGPRRTPPNKESICLHFFEEIVLKIFIAIIITTSFQEKGNILLHVIGVMNFHHNLSVYSEFLN